MSLNTLDGFPTGGAEVQAKYEAALEKHDCVNDKGECPHDIGVVLELPEAGFDIVCMDSDATVWKCKSEIPQVGEKVGHDCVECAIELRAVFGGGHEIDKEDVNGRMLSCIENESVLPFLLDKVMLWSKGDVWCEPSNPDWEPDNKIVAFLFVHGFMTSSSIFMMDGSLPCCQ